MHEQRVSVEATIIASIVGGMSRRAVAEQVHLDESSVRRIWNKHQANWSDDEDLRAELQTRLRTMLRAVWLKVLDEKTGWRERAALMREVRLITHEQALIGNLLHVQVDANINASLDITERREVKVTVVRERLASLRTAQVTGQLPAQAALPAPQTNGATSAAHNGNEAA